MNKLNLDWTLNLRTERKAFIDDYLTKITFKPDKEDISMMANYILWGKESLDEKDGYSRIKNEGLFIETRLKDWTDDRAVSLEGLLEAPGFSENEFARPIYRKIKKVFSRSEARQLADPQILAQLEDLWRRIDSTELIVSYYELEHGKRTKEIRQELLDRFDPLELESFKSRAHNLKQPAYLKLKHYLVELRKEQYTYQDSYKRQEYTRPVNNAIYYYKEDPIEFGDDIPVLPLSIRYDAPVFKKIFNYERFPAPEDFDENELKKVSEILWTPAQSKLDSFDFSNSEHLYEFYENYMMLEEKIESDELDENSSLVQFMNTARVYENLANLEPLHKDILTWKIQKKSNAEIKELIKEKYNHSYQLNYISTLYCKTIDAIAETAAFHKTVCENLFFPENFKKCKDCGKSLLLTNRDWVKRARSRDGFSPRCKCCEKIKRNSKGDK
jgi:hypothetical protein